MLVSVKPKQPTPSAPVTPSAPAHIAWQFAILNTTKRSAGLAGRGAGRGLTRSEGPGRGNTPQAEERGGRTAVLRLHWMPKGSSQRWLSTVVRSRLSKNISTVSIDGELCPASKFESADQKGKFCLSEKHASDRPLVLPNLLSSLDLVWFRKQP